MKVLLADLDGTLIETQSGKTFPENCMDMKLKPGIVEAIKAYAPDYIHIVTNQGGIEKGYVSKSNFEAKLNLVQETLTHLLQIWVLADYCDSNVPQDFNRKPNPGMLINALKKLEGYSPDPITEVLMIGDMDTDKQAAANARDLGVDIQYEDINTFLERAK